MHRAFSSHIKRALAGPAIAMVTLALWPHAAQAQFSAGPISQMGPWSPHGPGSTYMIDDGTAENAVGLQNGGSPIFLNSFAITGGNNIITSISIAFGSPAGAGIPNGTAYTAVLWSDPNGDGLPGDAVVLASAPGVVAAQGTNTFVLSLIAPTTVLTPNFFVGFIITHAASQFPAAFDQTAPNLSGRSFVNTGGNINNLAGSIAIESAGLVGNWLIRADAIPEPSTFVLGALGLAGLMILRRRSNRVTK